jgi:hypothetical protein
MAQTIQFVTKGQRSGLYLTDYNDLIRELNRVQPSLINQMKKDYRQIAKPVQLAVKTGIPQEPPTSGRHASRPQATRSGFIPLAIPGRLTWGANSQNKNKAVKSVLIKTPSEKKAKRIYSKNRTDAASVARLQVDNAAVVMADMAGKSGKWINKRPRTREYSYSRSASGVRTHKINNQGRGMIKALNKKGSPSRFVWKAAEKALPKATMQSQVVLNKAITRINRRMVV